VLLQVDTLMMKHFLSAFSDEDAAAIVRNCKQVLAPGGKLLLLQTLVPEAGDRDHNTCEDGVAPGECG
jgi:predicted SAM-dependent methyltransferase